MPAKSVRGDGQLASGGRLDWRPNREHRGLWRWAFHPLCIAISFGIFGLPILYVVLQSFKTNTGFLFDRTGLPKPFSVSSYGQAWQQGDFGRELINSVLYSAIPDAISLVLGVFLAFPIARRYLKHSNVWYVFFLFSGLLPPAIIPLFIETKFLHVYNSFIGYMIVVSLQGAGFFFFVGYLRGIPTERDDSAALDGCGYVRFILTIIMPEMKPALAAFGIFGFVAQWNNLILPLILLQNQNLYPVTRGLYGFFSSYSQDWPELAAGMVIVAVPLLVVFVCLQRYLVQGVSGQSMGVREVRR
jgi:raffinose/stachyose/melibiose transport system permease protein